MQKVGDNTMTILDSFDRSSVEFVAKSQLRAYGQFLQEFYDSVNNVQGGTYDVDVSTILVSPTPRESCSLRDLVRSGNVVLDKIMTALAAVCLEAVLLKEEAEKKFYPALIIYGEGESPGHGGQAETNALGTMAEFLPFLQELSSFVERCSEVVRNMMWQLASLYHNRPQPLVNMNDVHLPVVWESLSQLLSVLLTLDEIISRQPYLKEHFELYLKSARLVHHNPQKFALDETRLKLLGNVLAKLDAQLMSGFILQNCVEQPLDTETMQVGRNSALMAELAYMIKYFHSRADARLGDLGDREQCWLLTGTCCLYVLYFYVFRTLDKKLCKSLWDSFKKVSAFPLVGDILWSPCDFLYRKIPECEKVVDKRTLQTSLLQCTELLSQKTQTLTKECQTLTLQVTDWIAQLASFRTWSTNVNAELDVRTNHILTGLRLSFYIGRLVQFILNGHSLEKRSLSKQTAECIFRLIELLKAVEHEVYRRWMTILETVTHASQRISGNLLSIVASAKEIVRKDKKKSNSCVDMLAALLLGDNSLSGPPTRERLLVLALALQFAGHGKTLKSDELAMASRLLERVELLTHLDSKFRESCCCSFLLLHRTILPSYFDTVLKSALDADRLQYFFLALNDGLSMLATARHTQVEQLQQKFEDDFANIFRSTFLDKLCEAIENDLRLCIHTHLQLEDRNPFLVQLRVCTPLLHVPALRLGKRYHDIKRYVEQYLERTFYNLTTVALHDWRTYAEMRQLAKQKYGLNLIDPHLPSQTLEQGLDVLEIMRNIHIFVEKYLYNLNNQIFVEHSSNNKHLNVLNIRHIANSIRTHGTGIMSTTVNFTYQFLRKKFYVFSQFLYDDHIKSKLLKDVRYFREHKDKLSGMFPFEKADKFNRSIRKLGLSADGLSYFDQFRQLITQIGNALGYVRMVKSGGLQACAQAIQFIPDLEDVVPLAPLVNETTSSEMKEATSGFDSLVENLVKDFTTGTEYFKLFVDVFAPEFRNQKHLHLKNFYIIVPALTVNFVEHITGCKDKINRKGQEGAAFTDDGFSMGVAYILKLLDQYDEFDSLHWFRSVKEKYVKEKAEVEKQQSGDSNAADVKLSQTLTLTMKRIEHCTREFDLVSFSLRSARVFFRTDAMLELIPKEKDTSDVVSDTASVANMPTN